MLRFRHLSILTALLFLTLAATWMFVPSVMLKAWGVDFSSSVGLVGRRAAALYAGIGVMFFLARNAPASAVRSSLVAGMITTCLLLATLGVFEVHTGRATPGILFAALIEIFLVVAFLLVSCAEQKATRNAKA